MKSLIDYIDSNELLKVYKISKFGTSVKKYNVKLSYYVAWHGLDKNVVRVNFYDDCGEPTHSQLISFTSFNEESFTVSNFTYYLDSNKACNVLVNRLREKKRELDKKQMEVQKLAAAWRR